VRRLFLQIQVSLDGYIEDADGGLDWFFSSDEFEEFLNETLRSIDGMVFGRRAYELLAQYWPHAVEDPDAGARELGLNPRLHAEAARLMHELPKYVVTNTLERTDWHNSHILSGDIAAEVTRLKERDGKDIAVFAGAGVAASLMRLGLIDEYRLILDPALLGGGTPLFNGGYPRTKLELRDVRRFGTGVAVLYYEPVATS
jgi:dihydrofolate reductase